MGQKGSAMVRTAGVLSLILASAAAAGVAALRAPRRPPADPSAATAREGALQLSVRLDRRWLDSRGRAPSRLDKVFLATDGLANEGVSDRAGLLRIAARDFGRATVSTFGIGEDYDEDLLAALAAQGGGRTRFIHSASELEPAMRAELTRAARTVA